MKNIGKPHARFDGGVGENLFSTLPFFNLSNFSGAIKLMRGIYKIGEILVAAIFFLLLSLSISLAQNVSDSEQSKEKISEENTKTLEACRSLIGRTFWYRPGGRSIFIKPNATGDLPSRAYWKDLDIGVETSFIIVDCKPSEGNNFCIFKVEFPDKYFGYLIALQYSERRSDEYSVMDHMYPMRPKSIGSPNIFARQSQEVFDAEEKVSSAKKAKDADQKAKSAAQLKARGGVQIGMTTAQVLNSSWGKPSKVNRTTTIKGTDEQWVFGSHNYLYFTNGILTTIQN